MKRRTWTFIALSVIAISITLTVRIRAANRTSTAASLPAQSALVAAAQQGAVRELLSAVPFRVATPFTHEWRKEKPLVSAGYLLVLSVDPEYVRARETAEPVLYAGDQTIERVNHGFESGRVVAILPMTGGSDASELSDLTETPFWFGAPDLPERVDAREIRVQRERAEKTGARRFTADEVAAALKRGGEALSLSRREDLEARAALLVLEHAPDEHDLADGMLVPMGK